MQRSDLRVQRATSFQPVPARSRDGVAVAPLDVRRESVGGLSTRPDAAHAAGPLTVGVRPAPADVPRHGPAAYRVAAASGYPTRLSLLSPPQHTGSIIPRERVTHSRAAACRSCGPDGCTPENRGN